MIDVLNFIFSSLWVFIGILILISALGAAVIGIIRAVKSE